MSDKAGIINLTFKNKLKYGIPGYKIGGCILYKRHRFLSAIISYAVFLYYRFSLSLCDIGEIMAYKGREISYEDIRKGGSKFGQVYAHELKKRAPRRGDKGHLDKVSIKINGQQHWL